MNAPHDEQPPPGARRRSEARLPANFPRTISHERMNELPIRRYEGEICLVASEAALARALEDFRGERVVGFDTETRPAFRKGEAYPPCLVQAATARAVYIFQLRRMDFSEALAELLGAEHTLKVGISLGRDLSELKQVFHSVDRGVRDAGRIAHHHGVKQTGLRNLAGLFLGVRIPKGARTSNWAAQTLSDKQLGYASTDAWASREIYLAFERLGLA